MLSWLSKIIKGIVIALGFILPGISGGVLAAILGIYERMIRFLAHPFKNLKEDISEYHDKSKTIASSAVDSSNDVEYKEVDGDDCAYVKASYFIKEGNAYSRTYQMYVLRKDADGNWKILVFYQVNGDSSDDE